MIPTSQEPESETNTGKDLPGGPAVKLAVPCRGRAFDPWSGSSDPTCHLAWSKK